MSAPVDEFDLDIRLGTIPEGLAAAGEPATERRSFCVTYCRSACNSLCPVSECICAQ